MQLILYLGRNKLIFQEVLIWEISLLPDLPRQTIKEWSARMTDSSNQQNCETVKIRYFMQRDILQNIRYLNYFQKITSDT